MRFTTSNEPPTNDDHDDCILTWDNGPKDLAEFLKSDVGTYSRNTGGGSGAFQGHRLRGRPAKERKVALRLRSRSTNNKRDREEKMR
ncbi:Serine/threonine-protein kinase WNK2 [Varanus komodoensis]|nr:Serine/threonine-protein kinase WNK2 [Varanus komodoensis]